LEVSSLLKVVRASLVLFLFLSYTGCSSVETTPIQPANVTRLDSNTYQVTVDARAPWIHTGIEVTTGQKIRFNSDGVWGESAGVSRSADGGAAGMFGSGYWGVLRRVPDAPWGALVGRVGTTKFLIGIAATITTSEDGELLLGINMGDDNLAEGHGSQIVKIQLLP
jgi:hypothetical protein